MQICNFCEGILIICEPRCKPKCRAKYTSSMVLNDIKVGQIHIFIFIFLCFFCIVIRPFRYFDYIHESDFQVNLTLVC